MRFYLFNHGLKITDENICEARGKYLIRKAVNFSKAKQFLKKECSQCRSLEELIKIMPPIHGALIKKIIQHMLFVLKSEGVSINAKTYLHSVWDFAEETPEFQLTCKIFSRKADVLMTKFTFQNLIDISVDSMMKDIQRLWRGYFAAHGYIGEEFYIPKVYGKAIAQNIRLSANYQKMTRKELEDTCAQILFYAPYEESFYDNVRLKGYTVFHDEYNTWHNSGEYFFRYKKLFTSPFRAGSYKDMANPAEVRQFEEEIKQTIKTWSNDEKFKFDGYIYYYGIGPVSKFLCATSEYATLDEWEIPLICYDSTVMGGAEDGLLMTTRGVHIHNDDEEPLFLHYRDINNVQLKGFLSLEIFINKYQIHTGGMPTNMVRRFYELIKVVCDSMRAFYDAQDRKNNPEKYQKKVGTKEIHDLLIDMRRNEEYKFDSGIYVFSDEKKVKKKFQNALASYARIIDGEIPLIIFDSTFFGSAKDGFLITSRGLYLHNFGDDENHFFAYDNMTKFEIRSKEVYLNDVKLDLPAQSHDDKERILTIIQKLKDYFT